MPYKANRLKNSEFASGAAAPSHWAWRGDDRQVCYEVRPGASTSRVRTIRITSSRYGVSGFFSQQVACLPGKFYRVDAVATCGLTPGPDCGGLVVRIDPLMASDPSAESLSTPPLTRAEESTTIRAFFQAPEGVRRVRFSIGVSDAKGWAEIRVARFMRILEPEHQGHPFALLSNNKPADAPRVAERVCVCSQSAQDRPLTRLLTKYFGTRNVLSIRPEEWSTGTPDCDAMLLPDPTPPKAIRSLSVLQELAESRYVVISLPAFAKLSRGIATVRRIEQLDDPIHARVVLSNHAMRGFALHDALPFAWSGKEPGSYCQNHFRKTKRLAEFCKKRALVTLLESLCDRDSTSYQPVALCRETAHGGLFVLDLDPVECQGSTMNEQVAAVNVLLGLLGRGHVGLGQFLTPVRTETALREMIREFGVRFDAAAVHDGDVPPDEITEQMVTVGTEEQSFGLPLRSKRVILIRSGLAGGDLESMHGCLVWIKNLVRPFPQACPYGRQLASRFRIAWIPSVAPWRAGEGWARSDEPPRVSTVVEAEYGELAALIDVESRPINRVRVVVAGDGEGFHHASRWLPPLFEAFGPGPKFGFSGPQDAPMSDLSPYAWRAVQPEVQVVCAPEAFGDPAHQDALAAGGQVMRIEVPGWDADYTAQSIHRSALAAGLLEQVIGLQFGLIAVNRGAIPLSFDGFAPVQPGEALIVENGDPILGAVQTQAG